jgi:hypothetical protein
MRAALLGRADQKDAAEAFLRQAAEAFRLVAVEQQHMAIGFKEFQCGAYAGNAAADDDDFAHFAAPSGMRRDCRNRSSRCRAPLACGV